MNVKKSIWYKNMCQINYVDPSAVMICENAM